MNIASSRLRRGSWLPRITLGLLLGLCAAAAAWAQDDPPGRVGRVAETQGAAWWWDHESGRWVDAERNQPLTSGDRIATAADGRAELRVGSTVLRLAESSELEVLRLDDDRLSFQLHSGSLAVRVRSREIAGEIELVTAEAHLSPLRAGHYRLDRVDDTTRAGVWRGDLRIDDPAGFTVATGQSAELYREGRSRDLRYTLIAPASDRFAEWVMRDDQRDERSASARYVSPEMTGVEDLDRNGRWEQHPEYGAIWLPLEVRAGWAPYSDGRWAWVQPWGWTWVDNARWGFAPFHYGRWVNWRGGWAWVPGAIVARPVFAPALVAWIDGGGLGLSLQIGGPRVGWVPLAPREVYIPHYRVSPGYRERVNPAPPYRWQHPPGPVPTGPRIYANQGVPGAMTVVPREALLLRQPVGRGQPERREGREGREGRPHEAQAPRAAVVPQAVPPAPLASVVPPAPPADASVSRPRPGRPADSPQGGREGRAPGFRDQPVREPRAAPVAPAAPPTAAPRAAPVAPAAPSPAPPAAAPPTPPAKPAVERPRNADREHGRERDRERRSPETPQSWQTRNPLTRAA